MLVIKLHSYYLRCKTKYRRRSVDAHFQDVVGRLNMLVLHIKAANTLTMKRAVLMSIFYNSQ